VLPYWEAADKHGSFVSHGGLHFQMGLVHLLGLADHSYLALAVPGCRQPTTLP
jgi:hypothetical protein